MRKGLSLLEVLVSVFVLTLGIMGIAMTIPAGTFLMAEARKADMSAACGRAVVDDFQIRQWDDVGKWKQKWGGSFVPVLYGGGLVWGESYMFDPWYSFENSVNDNVGFFPAASNPVEFGRSYPETALLRRVYIEFQPLGTPLPGGGTVTPFYLASVSNQLTTWGDDLVFTESEGTGRPRLSYVCDDGENWAIPQLPSDEVPAATPLVPTSEGRVTWCVMVSPRMPTGYDAVWDHDGDTSTPGIPVVYPRSVSSYDLSVVVFHNRDVEGTDSAAMLAAESRPPESSLYVQFQGGGDALLFAPGNGDGYLEIRKDQWVLVKALDRGQFVTTTAANTSLQTHLAVFAWYRVVGVDDVISATIPDPANLSNTISGRGRYVTLAGPDWQVDTTFNTATNNFPGFTPNTDIAEAAIVEGVIGVYSTTVAK